MELSAVRADFYRREVRWMANFPGARAHTRIFTRSRIVLLRGFFEFSFLGREER